VYFEFKAKDRLWAWGVGNSKWRDRREVCATNKIGLPMFPADTGGERSGL